MSEPANRVLVTDVDMPFLSMVRFMVKWTVASIPAFLILFVLGVGAMVALSSVLGLGKLLSR